MRANILADIVAVSDRISSRNSSAIFGAIVEEVGELSTELNIRAGYKSRPPGPDGVVGEAIDALVTLVDFLNNETDVFSQGFDARVQEKLVKWQNNVRRMS